MAITDPIREEHDHLVPSIEMLRKTGDLMDEVASSRSLREAVRAVEFLRDELIPHAREEDARLYPVVGRLLNSAEATATMTRDHAEVITLTAELEQAVDNADPVAVRRLLYGLYHVLKLHLAKEEELYLPLLDSLLTPDEAEKLFLSLDPI
jgi:hemerythrin-like domain-containing protein